MRKQWTTFVIVNANHSLACSSAMTTKAWTSEKLHQANLAQAVYAEEHSSLGLWSFPSAQ